MAEADRGNYYWGHILVPTFATRIHNVPVYNSMGWDSSVGIATGYGLEVPGIESRWRRVFSHPSRPVLCPPKHLHIEYQKISLTPWFDPRSVQLVASRYTDWAILAHYTTNERIIWNSVGILTHCLWSSEMVSTYGTHLRSVQARCTNTGTLTEKQVHRTQSIIPKSK
jgi:hypothetical protein